jgi:hypothetical protein
MTRPRRHDPDDLSPEQEASLLAEAERGYDPDAMEPRRLGHRGNRARVERSIQRQAQDGRQHYNDDEGTEDAEAAE